MAFEDYSVKLAFARIEDELIDSMMRNLRRHLQEEKDEGFDWSQWQVEQLKYLEEYRRKNKKKFGPQFADINQRMQEAIQDAAERGQKDEEIRILQDLAGNKKIQRRYANQRKASIEAQGDAFFRINDNKLEALLTATQNDMEKAEHAVLRRANDQYRKIIFDAQVYANTGAGTIEKAVDMAAKDFLSHGIDSIEYKNGSRHTIKDYADMYIRTAERRAYLMGEGNKRKEWGMSLVLVNKRGSMRDGSYGTACPQCIPWLGKVLIDDVYSGGEPDGKHKLLSEAMAAGFLHPRCKDGFTTYFPGISSTPDPDATKKELKEAAEEEKKEARENYVERQADRQDRLAKHSLDPENRQTARHRANQWKEQAAPFKPAETIEEAQEYAKQFCKQNFMDRTFKGQVDFKGISLEHANAINRSLTEAYNRFPEMEKLSGIKAVAPGSKQGKKAFKDGADALFSYSPIEHGIFINKDVLKNPKTLDAYMQRSKDAWDLVMNNLDKLSGRQRELAERYAKAGRDLVNGDTVEGLFTHELGHHVQWTMLDPKTTNSITERMQEYAPHLSGYATASKSEYLAESFAAYMKGETDRLDPEYIGFLNRRIRKVDSVVEVNDTVPANYAKKFHAINENIVVKQMRDEYKPWLDSLTKEEADTITKYAGIKGEKKPKFYERLNKYLRLEAAGTPLPKYLEREAEQLKESATIISRALKKQPLQSDIICYRNVSVNPFEGAKVGARVTPGQFFSSSVVPGGTIGDGEFRLIIYARKGTKGAYIEPLSSHRRQREFLFDKDCQYRVKSINGNEIELEVVL